MIPDLEEMGIVNETYSLNFGYTDKLKKKKSENELLFIFSRALSYVLPDTYKFI